MTQQDFAEALGVRRATVSDWERGRNRPTLGDDQLAILANLLKEANLELIDLFKEEPTEHLTKEKV